MLRYFCGSSAQIRRLFTHWFIWVFLGMDKMSGVRWCETMESYWLIGMIRMVSMSTQNGNSGTEAGKIFDGKRELAITHM